MLWATASESDCAYKVFGDAVTQMRTCLLALLMAGFAACGDDTTTNRDMAVGVDMSAWDCAAFAQPGSDHPSGACQAGQSCGNPTLNSEGWHCFCNAGTWSCMFTSPNKNDMSNRD